ncbi:hypothetical protein OV079_49235 [Nannocystis pusilla]|uniref:Uncharacterized protein n=1 Tax=Nannocystis pusilla TaxID=889268 RepID=A0A9X3EZQ5_9BACT|nr:hypothetical protein [Nannocystis pusilla]MCY1013384.1 hypothetical protein [Nannocystis pusilla]
MREVVDEPFLVHETRGEVEVTLAVLDAILAGSEIGRIEPHFKSAPELAEGHQQNLAEDLRGRLVLPKPSIGLLGQERERRPDLDPDAKMAGGDAEHPHARDESVNDAAIGTAVDLEGAASAEELTGVGADDRGEELER